MLKICAAAPYSTILPLYITATWSVISAINPKSWLIKIIAILRLCCSSYNNARIVACTVTSKAVVGSSAINTDGLQEIAMAIITRCSCPPDSSWGYLSNIASLCSFTNCANLKLPDADKL